MSDNSQAVRPVDRHRSGFEPCAAFDKDSRTRLNRLVVGIAVAAMTSGTAFAEDNSTPLHKGMLPGVADGYRIAKPAPEPDDAAPASGNSQFKIGDTDVRISGSITFDVGAGAIKAPRR